MEKYPSCQGEASQLIDQNGKAIGREAAVVAEGWTIRSNAGYGDYVFGTLFHFLVMAVFGCFKRKMTVLRFVSNFEEALPRELRIELER